ncbi:MAG TPA: hypothetical protein VII56_04130 [Rhizomicrobium sp.]
MTDADEKLQLKISVLLHEYDALRDELLNRNNLVFQVIGAYAAVLIGLTAAFAANLDRTTILFLFGAVTVLFSTLVWAIDRDYRRVVLRIRLIESDVNKRLGEELMEWETLWGVGKLIGNPLVTLGRRRKPTN